MALLLTAEELRIIERLLDGRLKVQRRVVQSRHGHRVVKAATLSLLEGLYSQIYYERIEQERNEKAKAERLAEGRP